MTQIGFEQQMRAKINILIDMIGCNLQTIFFSNIDKYFEKSFLILLYI